MTNYPGFAVETPLIAAAWDGRSTAPPLPRSAPPAPFLFRDRPRQNFSLNGFKSNRDNLSSSLDQKLFSQPTFFLLALPFSSVCLMRVVGSHNTFDPFATSPESLLPTVPLPSNSFSLVFSIPCKRSCQCPIDSSTNPARHDSRRTHIFLYFLHCVLSFVFLNWESDSLPPLRLRICYEFFFPSPTYRALTAPALIDVDFALLILIKALY